jgi:hypothetical protein
LRREEEAARFFASLPTNAPTRPRATSDEG